MTLDTVVIAEFVALALGCVLLGFWKRPTDRPRTWLLLLGVALVALPFWFLPRMKGDGDGLHALGLVPLAILMAGPALVALISGFALLWTDRKKQRG